MIHTVGVHGILIIRWCVSHLIWSVEFVHEQPFQIGSNARCNDLRHTLFQNPCCRIESCCQQSQTIRFEVGIKNVGIRECVGPLVDKAIVEAGEKGIDNGIETRALYRDSSGIYRCAKDFTAIGKESCEICYNLHKPRQAGIRVTFEEFECLQQK